MSGGAPAGCLWESALDRAREHLSWAIGQGIAPGEVVAAVEGGPVRTISYAHAAVIVARAWLHLEVVTLPAPRREPGRRAA